MVLGISMIVIGALLLVLSRRVGANPEHPAFTLSRAYLVMALGFIAGGAYPIWPPALFVGVVTYSIGIAMALRALRRRQKTNRSA